MKDINTGKLIKELHDSGINDYMEKYEDVFIDFEIHKYLNYLIDKSGMKKSDIIKRSHLNKFYAYQILDGKKHPSRDKVLQFVFALGLGLDETQKLLKYCRYGILSPKSRRDAICIHCILNNKDLISVNEILYDQNEEIFK